MTDDMKRVLKDPEQGAATTVWAAVGQDWKAKGGKYLENCQVSEPAPHLEGLSPSLPGYAPHIYDQDAARKLWKVSNQVVGLPEEQY